jgi:type IV pilus assembly protein PilE
MKTRGFTLIELLVVIAIVGILAAIAIPSFNEQVAKSRRAEAMRGLGDLQLRQERWRANHTEYAGESTAGFTKPTVDNYTLAISNESPTGYTLTATRTGVQTGDRCGNFVLTVANTVATKSLSGGSNTSNCNWP